MPTLQDLREKRANIWSQMTEIMERNNNAPSGEDAIAYDRAEVELDELGTKIERGEKHEGLSAKLDAIDRHGVVARQRGPLGQPLGDDDDLDDDAKYASAFTEFVRNGMLDMSPEDRATLRAGANTSKEIKNALGVGTTTAGGYTIPPEFRDKIIETMKYYGPMLTEAEVITTTTGANLPWPTNNDTTNMGAILAENTTISQQDLVFGQASLDAYMYTSLLVLVSWQLLNDRPDIDTFLAKKLGQRLGRILNAHFTTGTGTAQPDGIVTSSTVGVTGTAGDFAASVIKPDSVIDLVESLDPAYGASTNLKFMGHQGIRKAIRKLKDSQNRYLWEISLQNGVPDSLLGYPYLVNNDMATPAASSKSLLFGDIEQAYVIRIVQEQQLVRLNERYADSLQTGFFAFERADGTMQDANAVRVLQTAAS
jgi:HK97 family phage major capsid protein